MEPLTYIFEDNAPIHYIKLLTYNVDKINMKIDLILFILI